MPRRNMRGRRRRPPWWFKPIVMTGLAASAVLLSMAMMTIIE